MSGPSQCSHVGTFRKVDAGMVRVAGEPVSANTQYPLVNEAEGEPLPLRPSGIAMFPSLKVHQLQVEDVLHLLSLRLLPPPVLTGEGRNLLSCRPK